MTNRRIRWRALVVAGLAIAARPDGGPAKRQHHTGYRMNPLITRTSASSLTRM
jgi:hypothetical protein